MNDDQFMVRDKYGAKIKGKPLVWPLYVAAFCLYMSTLQHMEKRILQTAKQQCADMIKQHQETGNERRLQQRVQ